MNIKCILYHDWEYFHNVSDERPGYATAISGRSYQSCSRCGKTIITKFGKEYEKHWTW